MANIFALGANDSRFESAAPEKCRVQLSSFLFIKNVDGKEIYLFDLGSLTRRIIAGMV